MTFVTGDVVNKLYGMAVHHSSEKAALELLRTLKETKISLADVATVLKKMRNFHALSLCFSPAPPRIVSQPKSYEVQAGTKITLEVSVTGSPWPSVQWYSRKKDCGDKWTPVNGAHETNLIIDSVHVLNEGEYCCSICNTNGTVHSEIAEVSLNPKKCGPVIISQSETPQFCIVDGLTSVHLNCKAEAVPPAQYQWYWNGSLLKEGTFDTLDVQIGGSYHCVASNDVGKAVSEKVQVLLVRKEGMKWL
jgi:hypothetical protein